MWQYLLTRQMTADRKMREEYLKALNDRIDKIIKSNQTSEIKIDIFPRVRDYVAKRFGDIDFSDLKIYISSSEVFKRAGFQFAYGLYVHHLGVILLQDMNSKKNPKLKTEFERRLSEQLDSDLNTEDILVHEMMHAVSGKTGRSTKRYTHVEEEFAYTNTIPFYKDRGLSDDHIVKYYLTFCVNDILANVDDLKDAVLSASKDDPVMLANYESVVNTKKVKTFFSTYADVLIPAIINKGKEQAKLMIDLYNKYGARTVYSETSSEVSRFGNIDFDTDL